MMRLTVKAIYDKKKKREKITVLTAYDHLLAGIVDRSGIDVVLVGDSLGMVLLGYPSTVQVTMRDMMHHTRAVSKAVTRALVVADMPFGSYDTQEKALRNAKRFLQEAGADAVKLEGGRKIRKQAEALIRAGIPVMGHLGLTPQTASSLGGYKVQGKARREAQEILQDAVLLDKLGAFAIVLECVPAALGAKITRAVKCPTIGIGAGAKTDGQVLVITDMLGFRTSVKMPRFVRTYASLSETVERAVRGYALDVISGKFPSKKESY